MSEAAFAKRLVKATKRNALKAHAANARVLRDLRRLTALLTAIVAKQGRVRIGYRELDDALEEARFVVVIEDAAAKEFVIELRDTADHHSAVPEQDAPEEAAADAV